jgi:hypothetical protein
VLVSILQTCTTEELEEETLSDDDTLFDPDPSSLKRASSPTGSESDSDGTSAEKRAAIKGKILAVGRMSRVFSLMREESERNSELRTLRIDTRLGAADGDEADHLVDGAELTREAIHGWKEARVSDVRDPSRPLFPSPAPMRPLFPACTDRERTPAAQPLRCECSGIGPAALLGNADFFTSFARPTRTRQHRPRRARRPALRHPRRLDQAVRARRGSVSLALLTAANHSIH